MNIMTPKDRLKYYKFLNSLPGKINNIYFNKLEGKFSLKNKSKKYKGFDPVTNIDKALELFIRKEIIKKFPGDGIVGEEFGIKKTKTDFTWVIDPIDGTKSFVIGTPTWSNLISINFKNNPTLGLANFPALKKYYITGLNGKSYLIKNNKITKLKVLNSNKLKDYKIAGNFLGWLSIKKQKKISNLIKLMNYPCSDALSYCQLCEGKLNVVLQVSNKIWDIHSLIPLIKNAGGYVSRWDGKDAKLGGNIIASSSKTVHIKILSLLKPIIK
jgi:fructose-1,6-bisphosphatase/inositol monophosphatase family enzyme